MLQKTPYTFDVSVWEFFWPLMTGATLVIAKPNGHKNPNYLLELILQEKITICHFVPSMLNIFLDESGLERCKTLRYVMCSGEALRYDILQKFNLKLNAQLVNLYGPTEAAIDVTYWICQEGTTNGIVPIGKPITNTQIYILDSELRPVIGSQEGELHIAGICLGKGYLNREDLTNKSFIKNPFSDDPESKLYKTGDLTRYLEDGNIEFLGRIDNQIKLRGFRIELGEIEMVLRCHPLVKDAVVSLQKDDHEGFLVGYLIWQGKEILGDKELIAYLQKKLPDYMLPKAFITMPIFPLTVSGKLDRSKFHLFKGCEYINDSQKQRFESSFIDSNNLKNEIIKLVISLLDIKSIELGDDLFERGATSLKIMRLAQLIYQQYNIQIPIEVFLQNPSIGGILRYMTERGPTECNFSTVSSPVENLQNDIIQLVESLLNVRPIRATDDLFELGATSLVMMRLAQSIYSKYNIQIPIEVFLQNPKVSGLLEYMVGKISNNKYIGVKNQTDKKTGSVDDKQARVNFFSKEERAEFYKQQWNIRKFNENNSITLKDFSDKNLRRRWYLARATQREFENCAISLNDFTQFIGCLRRMNVEGLEKYQYPSSGGTYAVQTYIHLKEDAVEGLPEGIYYYHPLKHQLYLLASKPNIPKEVHFHYNRAIYEKAGFSLYFIAQMHAIEPLYGDPSINFVNLEVGSILQLLMNRQAEFSIGLCPIGTINFDLIQDLFRLDKTHHFILCVIGGFVKSQLTHDEISSTYKNDLDSERNSSKPGHDIAIIGISGHYPGASNLEQYWQNLADGKSTISEIPKERWNYHDYHDPSKNIFGKWGGFIQPVDQFDPLLFNIAPKEAHALDPQQRLFLMQVWETLENAGYTAYSLKQTAECVGVFVGTMWDDYHDIAIDSSGCETFFSSARHSLANRTSFVFDFQGPSIVVDTSCSSALTALHLACESIRSGDCKAAIVGGVNLILHPHHLKLLCNVNMISKNDKSCAFGEAGTGWVPGEGVGCVLLKPLSAAIHDKDIIHGVIKSSFINHSGRTHQFYVPNPEAQANSVREALNRANIQADTIDYIECASNGSVLFDSAEFTGLTKVFKQPKNEQYFCRLGSVKPNIGHLESASAMSQLTKVLLQMKYKKFVPTIDTDPMNPLIQLENTPFQIQKTLESWNKNSSNSPRRAMISAFGGAGSYGHLIIEEYEQNQILEENCLVLIVLSAASEEQLIAYAMRLYKYIEKLEDYPPLKNIAYTLQVGRIAMDYRVAFLLDSKNQLKEKLRIFIDKKTTTGVFTGNASHSSQPGQLAPTENLIKIAEHWVKGGHINWRSLYLTDMPQRVLLPTYPFAEEVYWISKIANQNTKSQKHLTPSNHIDERSIELREKTSRYFKKIFAEITEIPLPRLKEDEPLENYGISSHIIHQLYDRLSSDFSNLSKTLFFQNNTLRELIDFFIQNNADQLSKLLLVSKDKIAASEISNNAAAKEIIKDYSSSECHDRISKSVLTYDEIAIIGISGQYPKAKNILEFWQNIKEGKNCIIEIPRDRWDYRNYIENEHLTKGNSYCQWGGFLEDVDKFDPSFFNIVPREAEIMDPQERLFLRTAWEVIEDAGYTKEQLGQSKTGVFVGVMWSDYSILATEGHDKAQFLHPSFWSIANRVSYCLNLQGPSIAIDTACSSSLSAIHLACKSIQMNDCTIAIAGGVNLSLHANKYLELCQKGFTSSEGKCRSFGEGGDGYVPAEGVGAVLLKPLKLALADGDHIYGVIKSSSINHGGKTNGYTVPNPKAHFYLIREALQRSGVNPRRIGYIEAHGTGTALGDPIEISGLSEAFKTYTQAKQFCAIGSVKSNIGHAEAAAGIAGITKLLLQFKYKMLVPSLHSQRTNKDIDFSQSPFYLQHELTDWQQPQEQIQGSQICYPRYAAISSFGAGGSNAHIILEEAPSSLPEAQNHKPYYLVSLSAKTAAAIQEKQRDLLEWLKSADALLASLESISYTLNVGRNHYSYRTAYVVNDKKGFETQLELMLEGKKDHQMFMGVADPHQVAEDDAIYRKVLSGSLAELKGMDLTDRRYLETLQALANLYVKGYEIDLNALHAGESRQRIALPTYPFARERYWIPTTNPIVNHEKIVQQRSKIFIIKDWIESPLIESNDGCSSIIIYNQSSKKLADFLLNSIEDALLIKDSNSEDYLHHDLSSYEAWIDLTIANSVKNQFNWIPLLQHWIESRVSKKGVMLHITQGIELFRNMTSALEGAEKVGLYRMLQSEYSNLKSRHVDLDPQVDDPEKNTLIIIRELTSQSTESEVCYRDTIRYVSKLRNQNLPPINEKNIRFNERDVLLVTGGTKGIGLLCAWHFAKKYGVKKIVLTGREWIPPRSEWEVSANFSLAIQEKLKNIKQLESLGVNVRVLSLPLDNFSMVKSELANIVNTMGHIIGIIHCAGFSDFENPAFIRKSVAAIQTVLSPKIEGLNNLIKSVDGKFIQFMLLCSSVSAIIPSLASGLSDYAMANAYMDYCATAYRNALPIVSIQWPSWKETGMGEITSKSYLDTGLLSITNDEGLYFIDQILENLDHQVIMPLVVNSNRFNADKLLSFNSANQKDSLEFSIKGNLPLPLNLKSAECSPILLPTQQWLVALMENELKMKNGDLDTQRPFVDFGVDSILLAQILRRINKILSLELNLSILFEYSTIVSLANWLVSNHSDILSQYFKINNQLENNQLDKKFANLNSKPSSFFNPCNEPIAVIGLSCQFPGAPSLGNYWDLLCRGESAIKLIPEDCWGIKTEFYAGLMKDIYQFDPDFFMIAKEDAQAMDPNAILLLSESLKAIYHAGYNHQEVNGNTTGVYIGARSQPQVNNKILQRTRNPIMVEGQNYLAANISKFFNFNGPSLVIDTACSSALIGLDLAIDAIKLGKIQSAIVGGVSLLTSPYAHQLFQRRNLLQKDGQFHILDQRASGVVLGEGVGVVYLKPLSLAQKEGDLIYAIIAGIGVNNDESHRRSCCTEHKCAKGGYAICVESKPMSGQRYTIY